MNLYQLKNNYLEVLDDLNTMGLPANAIKDTLDGLGIKDDIKQKVINIAAYIKNLEAEHIAVQSAEKNLQERANVLKNKIATLKKYIYDAMQSCNITKVHSDLHDVRIQKNPSKICVTNQQLIPNEFWITEENRKLMNEELKKRLKNGEAIPGCQLIQETSLRIK